MFRIFKFLYRFRAFFLFIALEFVAMVLIYRFNNFQGSSFFHTSNRLTGSFYRKKADIRNYFELKDQNEQLIEENSRLREKLELKELQLYMSRNNPFGHNFINLEVIEAKVINNTLNRFSNNYITLDKGKGDGVEAGMSVLSSHGIAGIVKSSSANFSVIYSLLHGKVMVSCRLNRSNDLATLQWDGNNYRYAQLTFVPKHVEVNVGDTVKTSGFNAVFPEDAFVGVVEEVNASKEDMFLDIEIKLATDFSRLEHAYVVKNIMKSELDSLQNEAIDNE